MQGMDVKAPSVNAENELRTRFLKLKAKSFELRVEPVSARKKRLQKLESWIHANRMRIQKEVHADYQKPILEIDTSEIYPVLTELGHALKHLDEWSAPRKVDATITYLGTRSEVRYEPKGTCLIISPWNFPFNLAVGPLISCLAAGNNAIVKPSELTPSTSRLIASMIDEVFPDDIVITVEGGVDTAQELLQLPFDHIFFTGSTTVGKIVMRAASQHLASVTLELGGKTPVIIDRSANLTDAAKRIAFGKFMNNGQTCIAPDYVLIEKGIESKFIAGLKEEVLRMFGGGNLITEESSSYSRLATRPQYQRMTALVDDAVQRGAHAERLGSVNEEEHFFAPVILTHVNEQSRIWEEEIFGPILPVVPYESVDEAAALINRRPKPLALYIFSQKRSFQERLLRQTSSGGACINDCVLQFTHPNLPFGGVNHSGFGKSHGHSGFQAFSNEKPVLRQRRGWVPPYVLYPPYTAGMKRIVDLLLKWF